MTQKSLHWDGASIGDADTLTVNAADGIGWRLANVDYESPFVDIALRMVLNGTGNRGVLKGWANELACAGVVTPVTVATGGAIVYGMPYENTAIVNVVVPTPTNDTRYDYIVLRRDWTAQTIRITRIAGVEGGGIPALVQSPAPSGTGIYDVPLATLAIDIAGAITVTDAREWCTFSTVPLDDGLVTANFTNESADWTARQTRTKRFFLGGGDLEPNVVSGRFSYSAASYIGYGAGAPTWGSTLVTEEGWILTTTWGAQFTFKMPADFAGGDVIVYGWVENDTAGTGGCSLRTAAQVYEAGGGVSYVTYTNATFIGTVQGEVIRAAAKTLTGLTGDELILMATYMYATTGTGRLLLGFEVEYTGYL
jgi:hypothetical protein